MVVRPLGQPFGTAGMSAILLVGGGIAGITVATELHRLGLPFTWVEAGKGVGGALMQVHNPLYGWPEMAGMRGAEAAENLAALPICKGLQTGVKVASIVATKGCLNVTWVQDGVEQKAAWDRVVLCTGTTRRFWEVPGMAELLGRGIAYSTHADGERYRGLPVAVVGGGDAAVEGALRMAAMGCRVWLLVRGPQLRASADFAAKLASTPEIEVCFGTEVKAVTGAQVLDGVMLSDGRRLKVCGLFIRVGVAPVLPYISPAPVLDDGGYLSVDEAGRSSLRGLFGAGEVTSREVSQVVAVQAQALRVAKAVAGPG